MRCKEIICDICGRHMPKEKTTKLWARKYFETYEVEFGMAFPYIASTRGRIDICDDCIKKIAESLIEQEEHNEQ